MLKIIICLVTVLYVFPFQVGAVARHAVDGFQSVPDDGMILWLKSESLNASGLALERWEDASGAGNHAVQPVEQRRPVARPKQINGQAAVLFEGPGKHMNLPELKIPYETTVFIVSYDQPQASRGHHGLLIADNNPYRRDGKGYGIGYHKAGYDGMVVTLSNGRDWQHLRQLCTQRSRFAWEAITVRKEGREGVFLRDGIVRDRSPLDRGEDAYYHTGYRLGGDIDRYDYEGGIAEVLLYDRALSAEELQQVHDYLREKYDLPLAHDMQPTSKDPRFFHNGIRMWDARYADQPYIVKLSETEWLAGVTTSDTVENAPERHIRILRSSDAGRSWAPISVLEPKDELRQPSWGTFLKTPAGRIYCFYNINRLPGEGHGVHYVYRFTEDGGLTWSQRYVMPVRDTWHNEMFGRYSSWGIDQPLIVGDTVYIAFSKYGPDDAGRVGAGFVFKSDNILSVEDAAAIRWEMLPEDEHGITSPRVGTLQEEHNIVSLGGEVLYVAFRTIEGYVGESYSRDGGETWTEPDFMRDAGGRKIKNPRACPMMWRCENGKYLLWTHNNDGRQALPRNQDRNPAWLSGGVLKDGRIRWSQPEPILFTYFPYGMSGMSYPDLVEHDGEYFIAVTDKRQARLCRVDGELVENLWIQNEWSKIPETGLLYDTGAHVDRDPPAEWSPGLDDRGFTVTLGGSRASTPDGILWEVRDHEGRGVWVRRMSCGRISAEYQDRHMNMPHTWATDKPVAHDSIVSFIFDGAAKWLYVVVDGLINDGGDERQRGFAALPFQAGALTDGPGSVINGAQRVLLHTRSLSISETIALHRALTKP